MGNCTYQDNVIVYQLYNHNILQSRILVYLKRNLLIQKPRYRDVEESLKVHPGQQRIAEGRAHYEGHRLGVPRKRAYTPGYEHQPKQHPYGSLVQHEGEDSQQHAQNRHAHDHGDAKEYDHVGVKPVVVQDILKKLEAPSPEGAVLLVKYLESAFGPPAKF